MILRPGRSDRTARRAHDRGRLSAPGTVPVRTRCPVDSVFQHTGNRIVVFGRHEQNRIRLTYLAFEFNDHFVRILLIVLIETRDALKIKDLDGRSFRYELYGGPERTAVVRTMPKAPGDPQYANRSIHFCYLPYATICYQKDSNNSHFRLS